MILIQLLIIMIIQFARLPITKCQSLQFQYKMETDCDLDWTNSLSNLIRTLPVKIQTFCLAECNKMANCKTASFSVQESICRLYDKSQQDAGAVKVTSIGKKAFFKRRMNTKKLLPRS